MHVSSVHLHSGLLCPCREPLHAGDICEPYDYGQSDRHHARSERACVVAGKVRTEARHSDAFSKVELRDRSKESDELRKRAREAHVKISTSRGHDLIGGPQEFQGTDVPILLLLVREEVVRTTHAASGLST